MRHYSSDMILKEMCRVAEDRNYFQKNNQLWDHSHDEPN